MPERRRVVSLPNGRVEEKPMIGTKKVPNGADRHAGRYDKNRKPHLSVDSTCRVGAHVA